MNGVVKIKNCSQAHKRVAMTTVNQKIVVAIGRKVNRNNEVNEQFDFCCSLHSLHTDTVVIEHLCEFFCWKIIYIKNCRLIDKPCDVDGFPNEVYKSFVDAFLPQWLGQYSRHLIGLSHLCDSHIRQEL